MSYKKQLRWIILVCVSFLMLQTATGIGETLSPWSQALINILSAFTYDSKSREKHTVVLFRESDLVDKVTGEVTPFPVPYNKHIEILDQIARHSPKAILVDFSFIDNREGDDVNALINQLCAIHQNNTKLYLSTFNYSLPNFGLRKEIAKASLNTDSNYGCFRIVPVEYSPEINGITHSFELFQKYENKLVKSAPLQIYTDTVESTKVNFLENSPKMDIVWGWTSPKVTKSDAQCEKFRLITTLRNLFTKGPLSLIQDCPYSYTLNVHNILYESSDAKRSLIHNKIVLYGGQFEGSSDYVISPTNGSIPGVYLLDMVLDNLITYGDSYKSIEPFRALNLRSVTFWLDIFIITIGVGFYLYNNSVQKRLKILTAIISNFIFNAIIRIRQSFSLDFIRFKNNKSKDINISRMIEQSKTNKFESLNNSSNHIWIFVVFSFCAIFYFTFDLGARNFLAFIFFIGITTKIDKWISNHTTKIHHQSLKKKLNYKLTLFVSLFVTSTYIRWVYENELNIDWYFALTLVFLFSRFVIAVVFSFLCWVYEENLYK